jgi:uncharacterized protein with von Willebrand factor type A (vWA) domain
VGGEDARGSPPRGRGAALNDGYAELAGFGRALREAGLPVGPGRIAALCSAAGLLEPDDLYWAGRATVVARPEQIAVYDQVFAEYFAGPRPVRARDGVEVTVSGAIAEELEVGMASSDELLREKSFARCTDEELAALAALMARSLLVPQLRRTRRLERARRGTPDLRRTLRRSVRTGGEPVELARRRRRVQPRRLVLLLDLSASMADYARALLLYAHAAVRSDTRCEVFSFGTRLTRLTPALRTGKPDEALERVAALAVDRDAGTRIGEALKAFLDEYGHRGLARGALVVICSDGLEVGDPSLLGEQAERLARLAWRVVWLNPLKGDPAYEPLTRGMRAALPHVDLLASGHNLASLELVSAALRAPGRPASS